MQQDMEVETGVRRRLAGHGHRHGAVPLAASVPPGVPTWAPISSARHRGPSGTARHRGPSGSARHWGPSGSASAWLSCAPTRPAQGAKKTKLGLREFVKLGDFVQSIDTASSQAVSVALGRRSERGQSRATSQGAAGCKMQNLNPKLAGRCGGCNMSSPDGLGGLSAVPAWPETPLLWLPIC